MKYLSIIFVLIFAISVHAATFTVNNNGDTSDHNKSDNLCADFQGNCTLRAAIQQANASEGDDRIVFSLTVPSTITLTSGYLNIDSNMTIAGPGARNLIISGNNSTQVFLIFFAALNLSGVTVADGYSGNQAGGGINSMHGTLNLREVTVRNNTAIGGGGIYSIGTTNIIGSTISHNVSTNSSFGGGGVNVNVGTVNISNSTISDNKAINGGGIMNFENLILNNVTISNNTATAEGGGVFNFGMVYLRNTIIASNNSTTGNPDAFSNYYPEDYARPFVSLGSNLIGIGEATTGFFNGVNNDQTGTFAAPLDPKLGELQNNGGQTDTRALLDGSPAIDTGDNCVLRAICSTYNPLEFLRNDQRGFFFPRLAARVDIGAYEKQPNCVYTLNTASQDFPASGGSGVVTGTTGIGCTLSLFTSSTFINSNIITASGDLGSGILTFTVPFTVQANTGAARTGTLLIGGQTFTVHQAGVKSRKRVRFF